LRLDGRLVVWDGQRELLTAGTGRAGPAPQPGHGTRRAGQPAAERQLSTGRQSSLATRADRATDPRRDGVTEQMS
jgi:hypothetical protein